MAAHAGAAAIGEQADAQAAFRDAWTYSTSELASRPGPALQSLNGRIIAADPGLLSVPFIDSTPPAT